MSEKISVNLKTALKLLRPLLGYALAISEYLFLKNVRNNKHSWRYLLVISIPLIVYFILLAISLLLNKKGKARLLKALIYNSALYLGIYLFLAYFDYLTLKTGKLTYPFIPWLNDIINAAVADIKMLLKSSLFSMRLLFLGYFFGLAFGLVTGVFCGQEPKVDYWINPILNILGPIPTATWLPLVMILSPTAFKGSVFVIALGVWYTVASATRIGIKNVRKDYFDCAKILGAKRLQLIIHISIPAAMPNIIQGCTQGMSSACISLMIAEMIGVEAGLGWYIEWAKAWAMFNRMFAAIIVICFLFNMVNLILNKIKNHLLRWQAVRA